MSETLVIPARTFQQIPGTDAEIAVWGDEPTTLDVTGQRSDDGAFRVEAEVKVGDTTITLRIPRGQQ